MKRPMGRTAWLVPLLTALVFFVMSSAMAEGIPAQGFNGKVTLDVNPSVELNIENGIVTGVNAYNEEGQLILQNTSLAGLTAEASLQAVLAELAAGGYLASDDSEPYLLITTLGSGHDDDFAKELEETAKEYMDGLGTDYKVESASLRDDVSMKAAALGLSAGRYVMMQYIAQTQGITIEDAIAQFGGSSVKTLIETFEGMEDAIKGDGDELDTNEEDEEFLGDDGENDDGIGEEEDEDDGKDDELDDEDEDKEDEDEDEDEEKTEEQLLIEKQQREEEKKQREEERRLEEQKREEEKQQREEERRLEEQKREEEKQQREEERRLEEQKREEEKQQREEERRLEEQKREEDKKQREEERRLEEQKREEEKEQREEERDNEGKGKN